MPSELFDFACTIKLDRPLSWLVNDGTQDVWVPKSIGEYDDRDHVMTVPQWFAKEKGLI